MVDRILGEIVRCERPRVLAALVAFCRDLDLAEDAFQDACLRAHQNWPSTAVPDKPGAWLHTVARQRCVDLLRQRNRSAMPDSEIERAPEIPAEPGIDDAAPDEFPDERLRLLFICCHPALPAPAQVALALRHLCGLTTLEISRALVEAESTTAQRLVRAKQKLREAGIPYRVPSGSELPDRLATVLTSLYLLFNEGYSSTGGEMWLRPDLAAEALRLTRLVVELLPQETEARGLLALMSLHHSRRDSRMSNEGHLILMDDQDRSLWHWEEIAAAHAELDLALACGRPGPYQIQAAIAALHTSAASAAETDWRQIALLYGALLETNPSPVVQLNAAVACAFAYGIEHGLAWIERIEASAQLKSYHLLPSAKAELLRRAGRTVEALAAYDMALMLVNTVAETEHLQRRRSTLAGLGEQT